MRRLNESIRIANKILSSIDEDDLDKFEIESALASHCIVLLYSECEQRIKDAVKARCRRHPDELVSKFAIATSDMVTGKMTLSDLKGTLRKFSGEVCDHFDDNCKQDGRPLNIVWDNMFKARKNVAHLGNNAEITMSELIDNIKGCRKVIEYYSSALDSI